MIIGIIIAIILIIHTWIKYEDLDYIAVSVVGGVAITVVLSLLYFAIINLTVDKVEVFDSNAIPISNYGELYNSNATIKIYVDKTASIDTI